MDKKTLVTLVGGLVFLVILVVAVDSIMGGLPGATHLLFKQESQKLEQAENDIKRDQTTVDDLISKDTPFLDPIRKRESWNEVFVQSQQTIKEAQGQFDKDVRPLVEKDNSDDAIIVRSRLNTIKASRLAALKNANAIRLRAEKLVRFKARRKQIVAEAKDCYAAIDMAKVAALTAKAAQAGVDWPDKKSDIDNRMQIFQTLKDTAETSYNFVVEENKKPENEINFDALVSRDEGLKQAKDSFLSSITSISALLDQLYVSWDKILNDMEIREGYEVEFYHHYKMIKVDKDNKEKVDMLTQKVSKTIYNRHEKHLGMALESKPKGKYDFEAVKQTSPPGYNYVGNRHYGQWKRDSHGNSFWVFYGQYHFMRSLFWGPSYYQPIYRSSWDTYNTYRSTGRTYFGRDTAGRQVYGSQGTLAKSKYANSKYTTKKGFSSTQYKKSGGKYRGSKYATSRSKYSSRSFSSGSRSSRSSGGK